MSVEDQAAERSAEQVASDEPARRWWDRRTVTVALWVVAVGFAAERLHEIHAWIGYGADFTIVWHAAHNFLHHGTDWSGYVYPPSSLLVVWPVALVPLRVARAGMFPVTVLLIAGSAVASLRMVAPGRLGARNWALCVIALAAFFPDIHLAEEMNLTSVILGLYVLALWLLSRGRWATSGAVLGLSLAIKPLLFPMLIPLILARKWKALAWAVAIPVVANAIAVPLVRNPGGMIRDILQTFSSVAAVPDIESVAGVGSIIHAPSAVVLGVRAVTVVLGVAAVWLVYRRRSHELDGVVAFIELTSVGLLVQFLAFTISWDFYLVLLIPLAALVRVPGSAGRPVLLWVAFLLVGIHVVYVPPSVNQVAAFRGEDLRACLGMLLALVTLLLWGLGVRQPDAWLGLPDGDDGPRTRAVGDPASAPAH
jgi:arabinofuranan 3-O-arabinosyltransferase